MPRPALARLSWLFLGAAGALAPRLAQAQAASPPPAAADTPVAAPTVQAPVADTPAAAPTVQAPVADTPAAAPAVQAPVADTPVAAPAVQAPVADTPVAAPAAGTPAPARGGLEILASLGWGASTMEVLNLKLSPYGASVGADVGYIWPSGFRLGAYLGYSLGQSVAQTYDPLVGRTQDLTADTSSLNAGISLSYDVPISCLVLRYSLGLGGTAMNWDFGSRPPNIARYSDTPVDGFHVAPGASLFWRSELLEGGLGFRYLVQANGAIPSGFLGELLVGVRL
jgi:hypothetical protein